MLLSKKRMKKNQYTVRVIQGHEFMARFSTIDLAQLCNRAE